MFKRELYERAGGIRRSLGEFFVRALQYGFLYKNVSNDNLVDVEYVEKVNLDWLPWVVSRDYPVGVLSGLPVMLCSYTRPLISIVISDISPKVYITIESVYLQQFKNVEVILTEEIDLGIYKDFARIEKDPKTKGRYVMHLRAGEVLHPTTLLELLGSIENYVYISGDVRANSKRFPDARKLLVDTLGGNGDWVYVPKVCLYTDRVEMACGSCGDGKKKKVYGSSKMLRCKVPSTTSYMGKYRIHGTYGEEKEVQPQYVAALLESGAWELVITRSEDSKEPSEELMV
jgi:hypothetical protein